MKKAVKFITAFCIRYRAIPIVLLLFFFSSKTIKAQEEFVTGGTQRWIGLRDAPNSLYQYISDQAFGYLNKRSEKIAGLHSLSDWQQRQKWIQTTLAGAAGAFPSRTPLNVKVTKRFQKDGYQLEDITYESQPGFYVTAIVLTPDKLKSKAPAVIFCSGHSDNGYRAYQHILINLAKKGFVVLAFDPVGQGERLQYYNQQTGKSRFRWPSYEHSYPGAQLFMTGNTMARDFIWDGMRAVDYLLTRKEVDPARIGITGSSGGGTQSAFIAAFDERIKAAAPELYITNFTRLFQSKGPQDAEQNFFYGIQRGIDMGDLLMVRAPKPTLMITTTRDMFPIQGALETYAEVKPVFSAYGKSENFSMVTDDAIHSNTKKNREAMYGFFQRVLNNPGDPKEEEIKRLSSDELQVTPTGQISTSLKGETTYSLNLKDAVKKMDQLDAARKNLPDYFSKVISSAKELSGYHEPEEPEKLMFAGRAQRQGYVIEKYLVKGEGNYMIPYLMLKPEAPNGKALVYLNPSGKSAEAAVGGQLEWFAKNGITVLAPDIIGTGELGPGIFQGDSYIDSVSYNLWFASMLVGRSIVGIQAGDLVKLTNLLKKDINVKEIYGLAVKEMSAVLLHAAAFDDDFKKIALIGPYSSYRSVVMTPDYNAGFLHSVVPGAIGKYDLPDLAANLAPRKLLMVDVTDANGNHTSIGDINKDLAVIKAAYEFRNANSQLQMPSASAKLPDSLKSWLDN